MKVSVTCKSPSLTVAVYKSPRCARVWAQVAVCVCLCVCVSVCLRLCVCLSVCMIAIALSLCTDVLGGCLALCE